MQRRRSRRNEERRRHLIGLILKFIVGIGTFGMVVFYAYEVGYRVAQGEVASLKDQLSDANTSLSKIREQAEGDRAALNEQRKQADDLRGLYEQTKPSDDMKDIVSLAKNRIADGVEPKRLAFAIKSAPSPRQCETLPVKRFLVRTPKVKGPSTTMAVRLDDALEISADGIGGNDGREQWFDPDRPVRLHMAQPGQKDGEIGGKLPVERSIMLHTNSELHFTVTASVSRGYADVASERCELK